MGLKVSLNWAGSGKERGEGVCVPLFWSVPDLFPGLRSTHFCSAALHPWHWVSALSVWGQAWVRWVMSKANWRDRPTRYGRAFRGRCGVPVPACPWPWQGAKTVCTFPWAYSRLTSKMCELVQCERASKAKDEIRQWKIRMKGLALVCCRAHPALWDFSRPPFQIQFFQALPLCLKPFPDSYLTLRIMPTSPAWHPQSPQCLGLCFQLSNLSPYCQIYLSLSSPGAALCR